MKPLSSPALLVAGIACLCLLIVDVAPAAVIWKASNNNNANLTTSWWTTETGTTNPASIGASDTLRFGGSGQGAHRAILLGGDLTAGALRVDNETGTPNYNATINPGNTLTLNGNNDYSGGFLSGIVLNSGTGGSLAVNSNLALGASQRWVTSRTLSIGGNVNLGGNTLTFHNAGSATTTVSGILSNGAVAQQFGGGGSTVILSGANTYGGGTTLSVGTLRVSTSDSALGSGALTFAGNSTLATANGGGARNLANNISINGGATATFDGGYADLTLSGIISGAGNLSQISIGKVILSGANTYAGTTFVNGANGSVLKVTGGGVLGGTAGSTTNAGNIVFGTSNSNIALEFETSAQLGAASQIRFSNTGGTPGSGSNLKYLGTTDQTVSKTLFNDSSIGMRLESDSVGGSIKYDGAFSFGGTAAARPLYLGGTGTGNNELASTYTNNAAAAGSLTKRGTGTWILSGANTYSGATTINGGTLLVNGTHTTAGAYNVNAGGTLGGTGSITTNNANITFASGSFLSPGASTGTLTMSLGTGTLNLGSISPGALVFELGAIGASDQVALNSGTLNVGTLNFDEFDFLAVSGISLGTYKLFDGALSTTLLGSIGTASGVFDGGQWGGFIWLDGANRDVMLTLDFTTTAVPEPSTLLLAALGAVGLAWHFRRRRSR